MSGSERAEGEIPSGHSPQYLRETEAAGARVMESVKKYLEKEVELKVNPKKSKVERATRVKFLGFSSSTQRSRVDPYCEPDEGTLYGEDTEPDQTNPLRQAEDIVSEVNRYIVGWTAYYRLAARRVCLKNGRVGTTEAETDALETLEAGHNTLPGMRNLVYPRNEPHWSSWDESWRMSLSPWYTKP